MAEGGYDFDDENRPVLEEDDYDEYADILMDDFSSQMPTVNEGEQAETSFGCTGLSAKTQFRNAAKDYKSFEYKDKKLFFHENKPEKESYKVTRKK